MRFFFKSSQAVQKTPQKKISKKLFFPEMRAKIHSAHFIEMDCKVSLS